MALIPGTRLGAYEVSAQIGEGGMGQVYRARDTKLGRDVALKILPDTVAQDTDRVARFKREAQVLAALNHPHIAAIYGFDEAPNPESRLPNPDAIQFLILELVEGETLADRVKRGPIPVDETIVIARQMAEALEEAHEKGIIHRDLKPANVAFTAKDQVKVLDFGLAKLAAAPAGAAASSASMSPTLTTPAMTAMGMILGTAAYMAPEQAKGREADKRSDLWAFGCVVFEMLTAKRAFEGEDITDTIASIMRGEPDWKLLPAETPANVRQLLELCLTKDRRQRAADIAVAQFLLRDHVDQANPPNPESPTPNPVPSWRHPLPVAVAAAAFAAVAVVMLWAPWRSEKPADRPLVRLDVDLGADADFPSANNISGNSILISPDGTRLVYVSGRPPRLFTRRLDQPKATELSGTRSAVRPFFSPDGQWVGFEANGKINKISVEGGAVVPLQEVVVFSGANWAEDGRIFMSDFAKGLLQFPAAGGVPTIVAPRVGEAGLVVPQLLPGGKAILSASCALGGADNCNIEILTLADGRRKILARGGQSPHYLPSPNGPGHLVYVNKATLFAIPFDLATLETRGTAVPVLDDVGYASVTGGGLFDVSRTGTLIYRRSRADAAAMATLQWVSPSDGATGKKEPLRATPGAYQTPKVSPDGKRIALVIRDGSNQDVWVYDPQRDAITRLTFGGMNQSPAWSPDGQYVVFAQFNEGMHQARADGASQPQALTRSKTNQIPWSFTPDGKRLAYYETSPNQIWTVPLEDQGGQLKAGKPEQFLKSNFQDQAPSFSPDGRWLAYWSNESGRNEVYVRAFPPPSSGQGGKWQVSNNGGGVPQWSRTGHELVYRSGPQAMTVSYSVNGNNFVAEKPRVWIAASGGTDWDLAPDGKRLAVVIPEASAQAPQQEHEIVMLLNFADELRRRVPVGK